MRKIWPFSLSFLQFAGVAFTMPFLVLYYQDLGFNGAQIGLLVGLAPLITLVSTPFWTGLADASHRHRFYMGIALFYDTIHNCQSQSRAFSNFLGGEKRFEDMFPDFIIHSATCLAYRKHHIMTR